MDAVYIDFEVIDLMNQMDEFMNVFDFNSLYDKYSNKINIIVVGTGSDEELQKQQQWIDSNNFNVKYIGVVDSSLFLKYFNFSKSVYVTSNISHLKNNAKIKILYTKSNSLVKTNYDSIIIRNCCELDEVLEFYLNYDYKTLMDIV